MVKELASIQNENSLTLETKIGLIVPGTIVTRTIHEVRFQSTVATSGDQFLNNANHDRMVLILFPVLSRRRKNRTLTDPGI